jgi:hypothetical protein
MIGWIAAMLTWMERRKLFIDKLEKLANLYHNDNPLQLQEEIKEWVKKWAENEAVTESCIDSMLADKECVLIIEPPKCKLKPLK